MDVLSRLVTFIWGPQFGLSDGRVAVFMIGGEWWGVALCEDTLAEAGDNGDQG